MQQPKSEQSKGKVGSPELQYEFHFAPIPMKRDTNPIVSFTSYEQVYRATGGEKEITASRIRQWDGSPAVMVANMNVLKNTHKKKTKLLWEGGCCRIGPSVRGWATCSVGLAHEGGRKQGNKNERAWVDRSG